MSVNIDYWYNDTIKDVAKVDVFFSDCDCIYRGNIYNKHGKMIGDYSCKSSVELSEYFRTNCGLIWR